MKDYIAIILIITIPLLLNSISGYFLIKHNKKWYNDLIKPWWNPPSYIFSIVWTVLYVLIGISLSFVYLDGAFFKGSPLGTPFLYLIIIEKTLNFLWSPVFFALKKIDFALSILCAMQIYSLLILIYTMKFNYIAGILYLPYQAWIVIAFILNYKIYLENQINFNNTIYNDSDLCGSSDNNNNNWIIIY